ncbi:MAG: hypothetical protein ACRDT8_19060 [Micromonosporaceae bacterium]
MTIGDSKSPHDRRRAQAEPAATRTWRPTRLGAAPAAALALAPVVVGVGFRIDAWPLAALGWVGVALLAAAALITSQLRHLAPDEIAGRRSVAGRLEDTTTRRVVLGLLAAAYLPLALLAALEPWIMVALVTAPLLIQPVWRLRSGAVSGQLEPVVRDIALVCLQYGAVVGLTLAVTA